MDFAPVLTYSDEEIASYQQQIDATFQTIENNVKGLSQIEKIKYVYDYVIDNIEYKENKNDQNILSALIDHQSVCAGYAKSYQYIMNRLGFEVSYIVGDAKETHSQTQENTAHAWDMVVYQGDYYYVDPTWGDVTIGKAHHCYGYFMMNSDDMLSCYTPKSAYEKTMKNQYQYYQTIHSYMENNSHDVLNQAIQLAKNDAHVAEIKCANENVYQQLKSQMENSSIVYEILKREQLLGNHPTYSCDDALKLVEIYF